GGGRVVPLPPPPRLRQWGDPYRQGYRLMTTNTLDHFVALLREYRLLTDTQLAELPAGQFADPRALLRELVRRGWLTTFQANSIGQGRAAGLGPGPYGLPDKPGAGGRGTVYQARHPMMDRVVAGKAIRARRPPHPPPSAPLR